MTCSPDSLVCLDIHHTPVRAVAVAWFSKLFPKLWPKYAILYRLSCWQMKLAIIQCLICHNTTQGIWRQFSSTRELVSAGSQTCSITTNQQAGVLYTGTENQYCLLWVHWQIELENIQCFICYNETHDTCQGFVIISDSGWIIYNWFFAVTMVVLETVPGPGPNWTIAKLAVLVVNKSEPSTPVRFDSKLPTCLK